VIRRSKTLQGVVSREVLHQATFAADNASHLGRREHSFVQLWEQIPAEGRDFEEVFVLIQVF